VSVGVSYTTPVLHIQIHDILIFVVPGLSINEAYCRDVLLSQQLLPVIRQVSDEFFVFQQERQYDQSS